MLQIYNNIKGSYKHNINFKIGKFVIELIPVLDPNNTTIKKGKKIYDYKNSLYFSLSRLEALKIIDFLSTNEMTVGFIFKKYDGTQSSINFTKTNNSVKINLTMDNKTMNLEIDIQNAKLLKYDLEYFIANVSGIQDQLNFSKYSKQEEQQQPEDPQYTYVPHSNNTAKFSL